MEEPEEKERRVKNIEKLMRPSSHRLPDDLHVRRELNSGMLLETNQVPASESSEIGRDALSLICDTSIGRIDAAKETNNSQKPGKVCT